MTLHACQHRRQVGVLGSRLPCADPRCWYGTSADTIEEVVTQLPLLADLPALGTRVGYVRRQVSVPCAQGLTRKKPETCQRLGCTDSCIQWKWERK